MKKRLAIVGYGGQGAWHATWAGKSDVVELAGIYDIAEKRVNAAKENGLFICAAPSRSPEIVVVSVIERAGGGSYSAMSAGRVLEAYYNRK